MSRRRVAGGALVAAGLAATMCFGTYWTAQAMQADLTDEARTTLEARQLTATVVFSGRDAYVWAETLTARADAIAALRTIPGVRIVLVGAGAPPVPASATVAPTKPEPTAPRTSSPVTATPSMAAANTPPSVIVAAPTSTATLRPTPTSGPTASTGSIATLTILAWPSITFSGSSPNVDAAGRAELVQIAQFMVAHPATMMTLTGYTDMDRSEADRQALGLARAKSAASVLTQNGVSPARIAVKSRGGNDPVASNDTSQGRSLNQRVSVTMTQDN